jgi:hypothetical protein
MGKDRTGSGWGMNVWEVSPLAVKEVCFGVAAFYRRFPKPVRRAFLPYFSGISFKV